MSIRVWRTQPEGGQATGFIVPGASQQPWTAVELRLTLSEGFNRATVGLARDASRAHSNAEARRLAEKVRGSLLPTVSQARSRAKRLRSASEQ
jgi:hypothetical protein